MKILTTHIKNFTVFEDVEFEFCEGINVFIGGNGTGKTHTLKAIYTVLGNLREPEGLVSSPSGDTLVSHSGDRLVFNRTSSLLDIFHPYPRDFKSLLRNPEFIIEDLTCASVTIDSNVAGIEIAIDPTNETEQILYESFHHTCAENDVANFLPLFIPAREPLSIFHGFIAAYEKREQALDKTFRDICIELSAGVLRKLDPILEDIITELEGVLEAKVVFENDHFFLESKFRKVEAQLIAEGHRKLASIVRLIQTGAIEKDSVLLWDEPEANLNPKLTSLFAKVIRALAKAGVQIFVATHDYLLAFELSMLAQHDKDKEPAPTKFFSFTREEDNQEAPVTVESADLLSGIQNNLILDEFAAHHDREHNLMLKSFNSEEV